MFQKLSNLPEVLTNALEGGCTFTTKNVGTVVCETLLVSLHISNILLKMSKPPSASDKSRCLSSTHLLYHSMSLESLRYVFVLQKG